MMMSTILLVLGCVVAVAGNSGGPPISACESMYPGHGPLAQTLPVPYDISLPKFTYGPDETLTVTLLRKTSNDPLFKGFFIQPRNSSGTTVGTLSTPVGTSNPCSSTRVALGHTDAGLKDTVTFQWTAPNYDSGTIKFVYTVVQSASIFWVREESAALTYLDPSQPTTAAPTGPTTQGATTPTQAPTTTTTTTPTTPGVAPQGPTRFLLGTSKPGLDPSQPTTAAPTGPTTQAATTPTQAPTTTTTTTPTTPGVAPQGPTTVEKSSDCGTDLGCYCKCDQGTCIFCLTWKNLADETEFTFASKQSSARYAAIGWSNDNKMGDDYVMAMFKDGLGANVHNYWNTAFSSPFNDRTLGLRVLANSYQNGVLYVKFRRSKTYALTGVNSPSDASNYFDANQEYRLFYAEGPYFGGVAKHNVNPLISPQKASFLATEDITAEDQDLNLVYLHATFMTVAWIFLASFGIFTARYYKQVWPEGTEVCKEKRWFTIHRTCMVLVFLFTAGGFVVIFVHVEGYSEIVGTRFEKSHPIIGITVMALALINPTAALFRPHPGTKYRPVFNFFHWVFGTSAHSLAIVNIFSGTLLSLTDVPSYIRIILYVFVGWIVVFELTFTLLECRRKKDRSENYEMSPKGSAGGSQSIVQRTDNPRQFFLILHGIVLLGFAAATVVIVWTQRGHDHDH